MKDVWFRPRLIHSRMVQDIHVSQKLTPAHARHVCRTSRLANHRYVAHTSGEQMLHESVIRHFATRRTYVYFRSLAPTQANGANIENMSFALVVTYSLRPSSRTAYMLAKDKIPIALFETDRQSS